MSKPILSAALPLALWGAVVLSGCATTDCVQSVGNPALTPAQVTASGGHQGQLARWGGTLVESQNLAERTELTILGYPLDRCGVPRLGQQPTGRFIAQVPGFLEPGDYRAGRAVTVTGLITGTREATVGAAPYRFPVLENAKARLWPSVDAEDAGPGRGQVRVRPWISVGVGTWGGGGWSGGGGGGIGVWF